MKNFKFILFIMFLMLPLTVDAMLIKVKPVDQEAFEIEVEDSDTVEFFKSDIESEKGINAESQILVFGNRILEDGRILSDYNIEKGSVVDLFYKTELTIVEMFVDEPKVGNKPDTLADIYYYNADKTKKIELKDFEIEWILVKNDEFGEVEEIVLEDDDVFEKGSYFFQILPSSYERLNRALEENDAYIPLGSGVAYLNGRLFDNGQNFYVGGVKSINVVIDGFYVGQKLPTTAKIVITTDSEIKEFILPILEWKELLEVGDKILDQDTLIEFDKKYVNVVDYSKSPEELNEFLSMIDFRTEHLLNGKEQLYLTVSNGYRVVFDANGGTFNGNASYVIDVWENSLFDNLVIPTRDGYKFVGYYTEKSGGTKLELILAESGIDEDKVFYARWIKDVDNPNTSDNIKTVIVTAAVSLIGILVSVINLVKERRKELL